MYDMMRIQPRFGPYFISRLPPSGPESVIACIFLVFVPPSVLTLNIVAMRPTVRPGGRR